MGLAPLFFIRFLETKDVGERQFSQFSELPYGVEVDVALFTEDEIGFLLAFDVLLLEADEVLHGQFLVGLEVLFAQGLFPTHLLAGEVGTDDTELGGAGCTATSEQCILGQAEVCLGLRHIVEELLVGVEGIKELIVLRDDIGTVVEVAVLVATVGVVAAGAVGQAAFLAHLLEDDGVHRATKVFVEEVHAWHLCGVEVLATEVLGNVGVLCIVVDEEHLVVVDSLGLVDLIGGYVFGGLDGVDAVHNGCGFFKRERTVVEHSVLVAEEIV